MSKTITNLVLMLSLWAVFGICHAEDAVSTMRVPDAGIQPQVAADGSKIHLIYFKGATNNGDIFYVASADGGTTWSKALRVNNQPGSAVATGGIRGPQMAVGKGGRVHVAWMGSSKAQPRTDGKHSPMLYARLNDAGDAFEQQRNVMQFAHGLDGGGSVAASADGQVYVVWHADAGQKDEAKRAVFVATSTDEGKTFAREKPAVAQVTGCCACCGMKAWADAKGGVYILYRAAINGSARDMFLLTSSNKGASFTGTRLDGWQANNCMMSFAALAPSGGKSTSGGLAGWETKGQVYFSRVDASRPNAPSPVSPAGKAKRKYPALAADAEGRVCLAWTEGMGWNKGGEVHWQVFDAQGKPVGMPGRAQGVPAHSLVAVYAKPTGGFTVIY